MNTDQYIHQFMLQHKDDDEFSSLEKMQHLIYKHPIVVKTIEVAGIITGLGAILLLPFSFPVLGFKAVLLAAVGGVVALASFVAYQALDIVAPPHHSMQHHVFKEATHGVGRIYYQGDVPILELNSDDPYQAGVAHGYLMGKSLNHLLSQMNFIKKLAGLPQADQVPKTLQAIRQKIPAEYVEELQGMVDGFNQWSKENTWFGARVVTVEDLILFHLMPDSLHFSPQFIEGRLPRPAVHQESPPLPQEGKLNPVLGCTVVIDQDDKEGITFGRNMDWPSFGLFGAYSLIINRKYQGSKLPTVELSLPGFAGTLTGMNKEGVCLAMNVCSGSHATYSVQGIPAAFFNRLCLENCHELEEVEETIKKETPLGSYHLSVADPSSAKSFHFYQGVNDSHVTREWQVGEPLITTNCNYRSDQSEYVHMHHSQERKQIIKELFEEAAKEVPAEDLDKAKLIQASLALPFVNNSITTHKVVMYPQSGKFQFAVDNAHAGLGNLQDVDVDSLFD